MGNDAYWIYLDRQAQAEACATQHQVEETLMANNTLSLEWLESVDTGGVRRGEWLREAW